MLILITARILGTKHWMIQHSFTVKYECDYAFFYTDEQMLMLKDSFVSHPQSEQM